MMPAERFTVLVVNDEPLFHRILHTTGIPHVGNGISEIVASSLVGAGRQGGALWHWGATRTAVVTSNTATGSNNSMHDSHNSLGGTALREHWETPTCLLM
jgi:K+-transporting ATPase A subunit